MKISLENNAVTHCVCPRNLQLTFVLYFWCSGTSPRVTTTAPPAPTTTAPTVRSTPLPQATSQASHSQTSPTTVRLSSTQLTDRGTTAPSRPGRASMSPCKDSRQHQGTTPRWPPGRTRYPPGPPTPTAPTSSDGWRRRGQ